MRVLAIENRHAGTGHDRGDVIHITARSRGRFVHIEMNADQVKAWDEIRPAFMAGYHPFLLHGVTGSGKTEIYLRAIEEIVKQGKEAIVLVPEIALTPQTIARFAAGAGTSRCCTATSRTRSAAATGDARRLGSGSSGRRRPQCRLRPDSQARTHRHRRGTRAHLQAGIDAAVPCSRCRDHAGRLENIPIVMGSATPSLESWSNAQKGSFTLLRLPKRVEDRPLPPVKLIDLRHEPKPAGKLFAIGPTLELAMRQNLKAGGQVILLLNRLGPGHQATVTPTGTDDDGSAVGLLRLVDRDPCLGLLELAIAHRGIAVPYFHPLRFTLLCRWIGGVARHR